MDSSPIGKRALKNVLNEYFNQYKSQPLIWFLSFVFPAAGNILIFLVPPLLLAKIVNTFVAHNSVSFVLVKDYILLLAEK